MARRSMSDDQVNILEGKKMKKVLGLAVIMVFLLAGVAQARYFLLEKNGGTNVTIHDPGGTAPTVAALYDVRFETTDSSYQNYKAFCVDFGTVNWNTPYFNYSMIAVPKIAAYNEAAWIYSNYAKVDAAAAQLAVWEIVFEQLSDGQVSTVKSASPGGKFYVSDKWEFTDAQLDLADAWAKEALNNSTFNTSGYRLLVSPDTGNYYGVNHQDFLVYVPEPGTMILLGIGLLGVGGLARRRKP